MDLRKLSRKQKSFVLRSSDPAYADKDNLSLVDWSSYYESDWLPDYNLHDNTACGMGQRCRARHKNIRFTDFNIDAIYNRYLVMLANKFAEEVLI